MSALRKLGGNAWCEALSLLYLKPEIGEAVCMRGQEGLSCSFYGRSDSLVTNEGKLHPDQTKRPRLTSFLVASEYHAPLRIENGFSNQAVRARLNELTQNANKAEEKMQ